MDSKSQPDDIQIDDYYIYLIPVTTFVIAVVLFVIISSTKKCKETDLLQRQQQSDAEAKIKVDPFSQIPRVSLTQSVVLANMENKQIFRFKTDHNAIYFSTHDRFFNMVRINKKVFSNEFSESLLNSEHNIEKLEEDNFLYHLNDLNFYKNKVGKKLDVYRIFVKDKHVMLFLNDLRSCVLLYRNDNEVASYAKQITFKHSFKELDRCKTLAQKAELTLDQSLDKEFEFYLHPRTQKVIYCSTGEEQLIVLYDLDNLNELYRDKNSRSKYVMHDFNYTSDVLFVLDGFNTLLLFQYLYDSQRKFYAFKSLNDLITQDLSNTYYFMNNGHNFFTITKNYVYTYKIEGESYENFKIQSENENKEMHVNKGTLSLTRIGSYEIDQAVSDYLSKRPKSVHIWDNDLGVAYIVSSECVIKINLDREKQNVNKVEFTRYKVDCKIERALDNDLVSLMKVDNNFYIVIASAENRFDIKFYKLH